MSKQELGVVVGVEESLAITVFNIYNGFSTALPHFCQKAKIQSLTDAVVMTLACRGRFSHIKLHLQEHAAVRLCVSSCFLFRIICNTEPGADVDRATLIKVIKDVFFCFCFALTQS